MSTKAERTFVRVISRPSLRIVFRQALARRSLSPEAIAVLRCLLRQPSGTLLTLSDIACQAGCGMRVARRALNRLVLAEYLSRSDTPDNRGRIRFMEYRMEGTER